MTVIIGTVAKDGKIVMGGDSAGVSGMNLTVRKDPKVFVKDEMIYGFTSSFRMGQLIQYSFIPPVHEEGWSIEYYMNGPWINALRKIFDEGGYMRKDNGQEEGGTFLVGYRGRLFQVSSDFQVGESVCGFDACGCGENIALGAMHALSKIDLLDDETKVRKALEASEAFSAGVRGPYTIKTLDK